MTGVLALAVGYSVRHNTDPPFGFEKTETPTTINRVYEIRLGLNDWRPAFRRPSCRSTRARS